MSDEFKRRGPKSATWNDQRTLNTSWVHGVGTVSKRKDGKGERFSDCNRKEIDNSFWVSFFCVVLFCFDCCLVLVFVWFYFVCFFFICLFFFIFFIFWGGWVVCYCFNYFLCFFRGGVGGMYFCVWLNMIHCVSHVSMQYSI